MCQSTLSYAPITTTILEELCIVDNRENSAQQYMAKDEQDIVLDTLVLNLLLPEFFLSCHSQT